MKVLITIKNAGVTPARNVKVTFDYVFDSGEGEAELPRQDKVSSFGSMMPNSENYFEVNLSTKDWEADQVKIMNGTLTLHVYGIITYEDAFNNTGKTGFHGFLTKKAIDGSSFGIHPDGKNFMT